MPNYYEFMPTKDLNRFLREYGKACLSQTTPPPPDGYINITWQTDSRGHLSAYVPLGGGGGMAIVPIDGGTPVFDGDNGSGQFLTLTQNVTSSTAQNFMAGIFLPFIIQQNSTGGWAMTWPSNFIAPPEINMAPNGITTLTWVLASDGNYYTFGSAIWV